jgi:hypothetical protein
MSVRRFADLPTRVSHNPTYRYDADDELTGSLLSAQTDWPISRKH